MLRPKPHKLQSIIILTFANNVTSLGIKQPAITLHWLWQLQRVKSLFQTRRWVIISPFLQPQTDHGLHCGAELAAGLGFSLHHHNCVAHSTSYPMGTNGSFPRDNHSHLRPTSRPPEPFHSTCMHVFMVLYFGTATDVSYLRNCSLWCKNWETFLKIWPDTKIKFDSA
jgi:hypothetical protein